jgi:predicted outer membrane repeat protein
VLCAANSSRVFRTASAAGLLVAYTWASAGDDIGLEYGLRAFWRTVCPAGVGGRDSGDAPAGVLLGDELGVSLRGVVAAGNSASCNGGAVSLSVDQVYARSRFDLSNVTLAHNSAGGKGGALFASARAAVAVEGSAIFGNVALGGVVRRLSQ